MNMPGFAAGQSLYTSARRYRSMQGGGTADARAVLPQLPRQLKLLQCLEGCSTAGSPDYCAQQCFWNEEIDASDDHNSGGGGGGGGSQSCRPHCTPCRHDDDSDTGRSKDCVRRNCDVDTVAC